MREIRAKAIINATASEVFSVLTDAECYPKFDPNCEKIDGSFANGERLTVFSKLRPHRAVYRIRELAPNELIIWESGLPLNIFRRVRKFNVIAKDDQTTEFQLIEIRSGYLMSFFSQKLPEQYEAFQQFAKGLKKFIESRP